MIKYYVVKKVTARRQMSPSGKEVTMAKSQSAALEHPAGDLCEIFIEDSVVAAIASIAASEVEGVSSMVSSATGNLKSYVGKNGYPGIKVSIDGKNVKVDANLTMKYGYPIPDTSREVQTKVKTSVENMTGLNVESVNVRISGITV